MIKIVYITKNGEILANKIKRILDYYFYENEIYHSKNLTINGNEKGFIFIMAAGIVLRKYIDKIKNDKTKDPFVIVLDELGKNIIPILSNHLGGGNYFSNLIGNELSANIVFTTATDINNKIGIDELATKYFLELDKTPKEFCKSQRNRRFRESANRRFASTANPLDSLRTLNKNDILKINKKVLNEKVDLILPKGWKPLKNISDTYNVNYHDKDFVVVDNEIILKPKKLVVGIGARKNIKTHKVYWAVKKALFLRDIPVWRIDAFATVDVKKDERGILEAVKKFKKSVIIFDRNEINEVYKFRNDLIKSDFVFKTIGVYGVSEPVSVLGVEKLADKNIKNIDLILKKFKKDGVSVSIAVG